MRVAEVEQYPISSLHPLLLPEHNEAADVEGASQNVAEAATSSLVDLRQKSHVSSVAQSSSASLPPAATALRQPHVDL